MLGELRPSELGLWHGLWIADPWSEERADLRSALVARAVSSGLLKKGDGTAFTLEEFMPFRDRPEISPETNKAVVYAWLRGLPRREGSK